MLALALFLVATSFTLTSYLQFDAYFRKDAVLLEDYALAAFFYILYLIFVAVVSTKNSKNEYFCPGPQCVIVSLVAFFALNNILGIPLVNYVVENMYPLSVASLILGHIFWVFMYIRSKPENPLVFGEHWFTTLYLGKEVRPFLFGKLDLKMYVNRVATLTVLLFDSAFLYKMFVLDKSQKSFLLVLIMLRSLYCVDAIALEHIFETSMEVQREGFGYVSSVTHFVYPFLMEIMVNHIYTEHIQFENWKLILVMTFGVIGYIIFRVSNDQMYKHRKTPLSLQGPESIPTNIKGKKLLCSGLWGVVRHPNYLGDILMQMAFSCFSIWVPAFVLYGQIAFLIQRAYRNNKDCKERYGDAWDKYCDKVRYLLVPGVY